MIWCVTGSRPPADGYTPQELRRGRLLLDTFLRADDTLIIGGAYGWDAEALQYGHQRGLHCIALLPKDRQYTDMEAVRRYADAVEDTGMRYWARDRLEVSRADKVLALPLYERARSSRFSGTWYTWDYARSQRKHTALLVIRGQGEILGREGAMARQALAGGAA